VWLFEILIAISEATRGVWDNVRLFHETVSRNSFTLTDFGDGQQTFGFVACYGVVQASVVQNPLVIFVPRDVRSYAFCNADDAAERRRTTRARHHRRNLVHWKSISSHHVWMHEHLYTIIIIIIIIIIASWITLQGWTQLNNRPGLHTRLFGRRSKSRGRRAQPVASRLYVLSVCDVQCHCSCSCHL